MNEGRQEGRKEERKEGEKKGSEGKGEEGREEGRTEKTDAVYTSSVTLPERYGTAMASGTSDFPLE